MRMYQSRDRMRKGPAMSRTVADEPPLIAGMPFMPFPCVFDAMPMQMPARGDVS